MVVTMSSASEGEPSYRGVAQDGDDGHIRSGMHCNARRNVKSSCSLVGQIETSSKRPNLNTTHT